MASYREKERRDNFESFANKIFTGIREINPEYAEKRAIWELFQNALDTIQEKGEIEIKRTATGFIFKHNGRPFTDSEFGGLIKQFSVGKKYGDNDEKLGQYGTGFISTHVYGKHIKITTSIKLDSCEYVMLNEFNLDRDADSPESLTDKLLIQDDLFGTLIDQNPQTVSMPLVYTMFEYTASEKRQRHIDNMLEYLPKIIPYIFCFNRKLLRVEINNNGVIQQFYRKSTGNEVLEIDSNNGLIQLPFLNDDVARLKVIIGSETIDLTEVPKLFLFYPLMETVDEGINFLIHADNFKPNRERDYLHKQKDNPDLIADIETNEQLLKSAFEIAINHIKSNETVDFWLACKIKFINSNSEFEKDLKKDFINQIRSLNRLGNSEHRYSIDSLFYFHESVLVLDDEIKRSLYSLLSQFTNLPPYSLYCEISIYVNNWNTSIESKFKTFDIDQIGEYLSNQAKGNYHIIHNKVAYKLFIKHISGDTHLLNKYCLIPNLHGILSYYRELVRWNRIENELIEIADVINYDITKKYLHPEFYFLEEISEYNREKFREDFSKFCNELNDYFSKDNSQTELSSVRILMVIDALYCFIGLNKVTYLNIQLVGFYKRVFSLNVQPKSIYNATTDINYQPAFKLLAHIYIESILNISTCLNDLQELLSFMFENKNLKEEFLHKKPCIPSQNYKLKVQSELNKDDVKDLDFKQKYKEVIGTDILDNLAVDGFDKYLQHTGVTTGLMLGSQIEEKLQPNKRFIPVKDLSDNVINNVLTLVEKISERPDTWGQWLPNINAVKEEILMHKFQNEKTRSSLFSILTKDEVTIELLGDLAKIANLEDLVKKGLEKQQEERRRNAHMDYITHIGLLIQDLIQKQLDVELANLIELKRSEEDTHLITQEEQNGQDFIIYKNGQPVYFIEVKSKWDENGRFALTKNQTEKCAIEKSRYAVVSVNVDRYKKKHEIDDEFDIKFEDINEFIHVNDYLGSYFEKLVQENIYKSESYDPKLIEFRGSIPQRIIDTEGKKFDDFIPELIEVLKK
ncbi:sacsin N-terminal ATP-binding-like domain-containing protein [Aquirufa ecclesiirivi]|uniref:sacsin N-terminal ATP-binding-like domain-containing protein n=1 Tax=Aquirufa ecclesiirivi TaxID=2715124 RepID=UPI0023D8C4C0|nr:DUF3883 domain-containing protein [Aquirufa ecclesiirivi]MDF0693236.1 DUF3883 domain-containing protein [Aquirufa ecclesiirivi]